VLKGTTLRIAEDGIAKRNRKLKDILAGSAKFLSYRLMTNVRILMMEVGKVVDDFHRSIFLLNSKWYYELAFFSYFVTIGKDDEKDGKYN
jgi:hypothetical protein